MQMDFKISGSANFVVALGASGSQGLQDLVEFLASPADLSGAVILTVLHRPVDLPSCLGSVLQRRSGVPVEIAGPGARFRPGVCYIGEPDNHLVVAPDGRAALIRDPRGRYRNRTVDALFESVAASMGGLAMGVVLSGALADGSKGLAAIRLAGGTVMARSPDGSAFTDMARNAIDRVGPLDLVGSVPALAAAVRRLTSPESPGAYYRLPSVDDVSLCGAPLKMLERPA
jgi:two-component system chemotaxis response regulator CheB